MIVRTDAAVVTRWEMEHRETDFDYISYGDVVLISRHAMRWNIVKVQGLYFTPEAEWRGHSAWEAPFPPMGCPISPSRAVAHVLLREWEWRRSLSATARRSEGVAWGRPRIVDDGSLMLKKLFWKLEESVRDEVLADRVR